VVERLGVEHEPPDRRACASDRLRMRPLT
jgi:hypothetical protein